MKARKTCIGLLAGLGLAIAGCQAPATTAAAPAERAGGGATPSPGASAAPMPTYEAPRITPEEAKARIDAGEEIVIVDVRGASYYAKEHIAGAVSAPWATLSEGHAQLPKDKLLLLYCT